MPSPFPGMDPYIESQRRFHTFHTAFITACGEVINDRLEPPYFASVEERILIDASDTDESAGRPVSHRLGPDVAIVTEAPAADGATLASVGVPIGTLVPQRLPQAVVTLDQPTQKLIEIRGLPDDRLITTVELLSASNKHPGPDRDAFLVKRADLLRQGVNLVDLDLLLAGRRVPLLVPLPAGDYFAFVTRAITHDQCDVYSWTVRDQLPTIPIPLGPDTGDVPLDLAAAFSRVYQRFHYDRMLRYTKPLLGSWSDSDRQWVAQRLQNIE